MGFGLWGDATFEQLHKPSGLPQGPAYACDLTERFMGQGQNTSWCEWLHHQP